MKESKVYIHKIKWHDSPIEMGKNLTIFLIKCQNNNISVQDICISVDKPTVATIINRCEKDTWENRFADTFPNW